MLETIRKEVLKKESERVLRNTIFNAAEKYIDNLNRDNGVARYTSTNRLFILYTEKGVSRLESADR